MSALGAMIHNEWTELYDLMDSLKKPCITMLLTTDVEEVFPTGIDGTGQVHGIKATRAGGQAVGDIHGKEKEEGGGVGRAHKITTVVGKEEIL
eukprot:2052993-Pyramimonas_sp.AAC.1